jgi:sialidase-1
LACLGDSEGLAALARNLQHAEPAVRIYAAEIAGHARAVSLAGKLAEKLDDPVLDVRVRAAQSLLLLSQTRTEPPRDFARDVYVATAEHPRYSEGSLIRLKQGTLVYATTEFAGGGADHSSAAIVARQSDDGGLTWGPQRVLQENVGGQNVMSVSLVRLRGAGGGHPPIALFYLQKNGPRDLKVYVRLSRDEAATFEAPTLVTDAPGYHVMNNDRVQALSSSRVLCPIAWTADVSANGHFTAHIWYSDDGCRTWRRSQGEIDLPKRGAMEPEVIEARGSLLMILRTQLGNIATSHSTDGGQTWTAPGAWTLSAPEAPATLRRIPSTGDWLLVWNNTYQAGAGHGGKRTPLSAAISSDEGHTWNHIRNLEQDQDKTYAYTSIAFVQDRVLLTYYVRDEATGRISSRFRSLPLTWFYGEVAETATGR